MKRAAIYLFFDPQGQVDTYITHCLSTLREYVEDILVVSNAPLSEQARDAFASCGVETFERPNEGFDVGGYKDAINHIGWDKLAEYDELILMNYTFFAPIHPWSNLFERVEEREVDFWGITEHDEVRPHPFLAAPVMPRHIQSHWIAVRRSLLTHPEFRRYWDEMPPITSYNDSIQWHESRFTQYFDTLGFTHAVAYPREDYPSRNPVFDNATMLLDDGCPILKRRNLFHDPLYLDRYAIIGADMLSRVEKAGYPVDYILGNLARTSEPRVLVTNAGLTTVHGDSSTQEQRDAAASLRIAAIAHIFYPDMTGEILDQLASLPEGYDLYITTASEDSRARIRHILTSRGIDADVRLVASNRGRDVSAFLCDCRDVLEDERYDVVVKIHSKKSVQDDANMSSLFKAHLYDNLLGSRDYTAYLLSLFAGSPALGMVFPPVPHVGYPTMGHSWFANRQPAKKIADKLGITVPFDANMPLAPYGSMFMARREALAPLLAAGWTHEDFPEEGGYKDGSLAHCIERLFAYASLSQGLYCRPVLHERWAGVYYALLEYKLAATSSMLPAFSIDQVPFLHARLSEIPNTLGVIKTNMMLKNPALGNRLKPAYRLARQGAAVARQGASLARRGASQAANRARSVVARRGSGAGAQPREIGPAPTQIPGTTQVSPTRGEDA